MRSYGIPFIRRLKAVGNRVMEIDRDTTGGVSVADHKPTR